MNAVFLPPGATPDADPVTARLREFAAGLGVGLPESEPAPEATWQALRKTGMDHPGLAFASWAQTAAVGGLLSSILANSPDVTTMLDGLERFHPLLARDRIIVGRRSSSWSVTLRAPDGGPAHPDTVDAAFAVLCQTARQLAGEIARPTVVLLRRPAPADPQPYQTAFGRIAFAQPADSCVFAHTALSAVIAHGDSTVLSMLAPYAERLITHRHRSWAAAVGELLGSRPQSVPTLAEAAEAFSVSPRTLQLRLSQEATSFSALASAVQRERALALLAQPGLPVTSIAARTGFATPAAFTRAFRRWTTLTPSQYREQIRPDGG